MLNLFEGRDLGETLHFVEEKVRAGLWSWDLRTGEMNWSDGHYALFGLEPGATPMSFERHLTLVHPEDRRGLYELGKILGEGLPFTREYRIIQPTGRMRWLAVRGEALLDAHGKAHRAVGLSFDITEQHEAQQGAVRDARFRVIMGGVAPLVWSAKSDGTMLDLLGTSDGSSAQGLEIGEHGWLDAIHPEDRSTTLELWNQAVAAHEFFEIEHRLRLRDGQFRPFHTSGVPHHGSGGVFLGWQGICIDLAGRKPKGSAHADGHVITGAQVRAARGILKWSVSDLALAATVSPAIIRRIEDFDGSPSRSDSSAESLRRALANGGVEFIFPADGRPGVRPAPSISDQHRPGPAGHKERVPMSSGHHLLHEEHRRPPPVARSASVIDGDIAPPPPRQPLQ